MSHRRASVAACLLGAAALLAAYAGGAPLAAAADGTGGARTILVLDSSGSMKEPARGGATKIEAARAALGRVVSDLPEDAEVGLRVFGAKVFSRKDRGACTDSQQVVAPDTDNRDALRRAIAAYKPYGETPIGYALRQAARDLGPASGDQARSIVLVSDGLATCQPDPCQVARELAARGVDLRVDVVGLDVDARARSQLRCIAAAAGGAYYDASSAEEIAESLTTASERALRPFVIDGEQVRGTPEPEDAPLLAPGTYSDVAGRKAADHWYRYERQVPGSAVVVSSYVQRPGALSKMSLDVVDPSGASCPTEGSTPLRHQLFTGYARVVSGEGERCAGDLLLNAQQYADNDATSPFGVRVLEVPPILNASALPPAATSDSTRFVVPRKGEPTPVVGGSSFADATELESGQTYSATIVPGEVNAYRVAVGWGQRLAVRVDRPRITKGLRDVVDYKLFDLQLLNPLRATVEDSLIGDDLDTDDRMLDRPTRDLAGTLPVRWNNRENSLASSGAAFFAGDYYVLYGADFEAERSAEIPYTLTVEVQGQKEGAPAFADGQQVLPPGAGTDATATPSPSTSASTLDPPSPAPSASTTDEGASDGGVPTVALVAGVLSVVAVLAVLAVVTVRRRGSRG